jgi:cobaltochelatase CobN
MGCRDVYEEGTVSLSADAGAAGGMSAACGADAALGNLPLIYPFQVNDPGEGTQAKRRAHATLVDLLIPPMARAET